MKKLKLILVTLIATAAVASVAAAHSCGGNARKAKSGCGVEANRAKSGCRVEAKTTACCSQDKAECCGASVAVEAPVEAVE